MMHALDKGVQPNVKINSIFFEGKDCGGDPYSTTESRYVRVQYIIVRTNCKWMEAEWCVSFVGSSWNCSQVKAMPGFWCHGRLNVAFFNFFFVSFDVRVIGS